MLLVRTILLIAMLRRCCWLLIWLVFFSSFSGVGCFISSLPQLAWEKRLCCCCCVLGWVGGCVCFRQSLIFPECNHLHQATCASYDAFLYKSNFWPVQINILLFTFYPVNHMVSLTWLSNFFFPIYLLSGNEAFTHWQKEFSRYFCLLHSCKYFLDYW